MTNDFSQMVNHAYLMECSLKPWKMGFKELPGGWTHVGAGKVVGLERAWTFRVLLPPIFCLIQLFHLVVLESYPLWSKMSPWVLRVILASYQIWEERCENPWFTAGQPQVQEAWDCNWCLCGEKTVSWDWTLHLWDLILTPGRECQHGIKLWDTQLVSENWLVRG